jgi:amino acid permease
MEVLVFSLLMVVFASSIRSLAVGLDIMSATCAMAVMFFMPGLFLLKGQSSECPRWSALARAFMGIGAVLSVVSAADVVKETM